MEQAREQRQIDFQPIHEALERPLDLVDNPERRTELRKYAEAAGHHVERAVFDLLSEIVTTINEAGGGRAHLQYAGGSLHLVVEPGGHGEEPGQGDERFFSVEGDMEKVTIRIPGELRELINEAANLRGVSVNSWYVRELGRIVNRTARRGPPFPPGADPDWGAREGRRRGSRLHGFVGD